jgi:hypothetical protein
MPRSGAVRERRGSGKPASSETFHKGPHSRTAGVSAWQGLRLPIRAAPGHWIPVALTRANNDGYTHP